MTPTPEYKTIVEIAKDNRITSEPTDKAINILAAMKAYADQEVAKAVASQQTMRWVKGNKQQPPVCEDVPLLIDTGVGKVYGLGHFDGADFKDESTGLIHPLKNVKWLLDESPASIQ